METTEALKRRIHTAEELHSLVRTMKALAAVNIRHLERAVESLDGFQQTVELGLRAVLGGARKTELSARVAPRSASAAIVMGSDQGMCGQLNEQIARLVDATVGRSAHPGPTDTAMLNRSPPFVEESVSGGTTIRSGQGPLMVIGQRVASRLEDLGFRIDVALPVAASTVGITPLVNNILVHLDSWHARQRVDRVVVFYAEHISRAAFEPRRLDLLPLDRQWLEALQQEKWPTRSVPAWSLDTGQLFSSLVRQYLFVALFRACAETLASENASRLAAMRGAERNISERITELTQAFHQTRQMAITEELLDIASGFEALRDEE